MCSLLPFGISTGDNDDIAPTMEIIFVGRVALDNKKHGKSMQYSVVSAHLTEGGFPHCTKHDLIVFLKDIENILLTARNGAL